MKKLNYFLVLAIAFLSFGLVSCDPNGGNGNGNGNENGNDNDDKPTVENVTCDGAFYMGKLLSHYTDFLRFSFVTGNLELDDEGVAISGNGSVVSLDLLADVDNKHFPKAGEYKMGDASIGTKYMNLAILENGVMVPFSMYGGQLPIGTLVIEYPSVDEEPIMWYADDATVTLSGSAADATIKLTASLVDANDPNNTKQFSMEYKGAIDVDDSEFLTGEETFKGYEDPNKVTKEMKFTEMTGDNFGDRYECGLNQYQLSLSNANKETAHFILYGEVGKEVYGTYTITNRFGPMTGDRTAGVMKTQQGVSVAAPNVGVKDDEGYLTACWFVDGGTVTISENKITYEVTSYYGSTLKGTYEGPVSFKTPGSAPQAAPMQFMLTK